MTPGARLAAAIEVLDALAHERASAEDVLRAWGREHRFAGSADRRAIAGHVFDALRARARSTWLMAAEDGRALVAGLLGVEAAQEGFTGEAHAPAPLRADELARLNAPEGEPPDWVLAGVPPFAAERLRARFGDDWIAEAQALAGARAPVDLRVNALRGDPEAARRLLAADGVEPEPTPLSAWGLRLPAAYSRDVQATRAWKTGWVEVQDEASQIAVALADARPGMTVVDYGAGGGGKTLGLAAAMRRAPFPLDGGRVGDGGVSTPSNIETREAPRAGSDHPPATTPIPGPSPIEGEGRLYALDTDAKRLAALAPRLERAGARAEVRRIGAAGEGAYDLADAAHLVFVDAPCTGSGTWRRHPEAAWRLTPEALQRLAGLQREILGHAARLVRPGGRLLYATCSVFAEENDAVAEAFAAAHPGFRPLPIAEAAAASPGLTEAGRARLAELAAGRHVAQLTPRRTGTDGFFVALFERTA